MSDLSSYYNSIPPFTRYFVTAVFASSFAMTYKILSPYSFILDYQLLFKKLHLWRFFTTFLFAGPFNPNFIFTMLTCYFSLVRCEEYFKGKAAKFMTLVVFLMVTVALYAAIYGNSMVLHGSFVSAMMYTWCKHDPN